HQRSTSASHSVRPSKWPSRLRSRPLIPRCILVSFQYALVSLYLRIAIVQLIGLNQLRFNIHSSNFPLPDRNRATCKAGLAFAFSLSNPIASLAFSDRAEIPRSLSLIPETRSVGKSPFCIQNQQALRN